MHSPTWHLLVVAISFLSLVACGEERAAISSSTTVSWSLEDGKGQRAESPFFCEPLGIQRFVVILDGPTRRRHELPCSEPWSVALLDLVGGDYRIEVQAIDSKDIISKSETQKRLAGSGTGRKVHLVLPLPESRHVGDGGVG